MTVHVATCAYPIEPIETFEEFADKQARIVGDAARAGAQILVFPEYASVELTSCLPDAQRGALARELAALGQFLEPTIALYGELARRHGLYILAPSFPERVSEPERYHNRARLHGPSGGLGLTEKLQMTRFEREEWGVSAGSRACVFETELGLLGVAICYDAEFPLIVRRQVEAGAELVLVPSCTDTIAGYHRVSIACRARALENQCFVAQASTVGDAPWSLALDANVGAAGVYGPVEQRVLPDGIVAEGELGVSGWVYADLDFAQLAEARREGQVRNHADWGLEGHLTAKVERVQIA